MGVREMERFLEQWQMNVKDLHRRLILAPTPRERERWHANQRGSWMDPIVELLRELAPAIPREMTVVVLCDRGLASPKLWQQILAHGWHPYMRYAKNITFCAEDGRRLSAHAFVPRPDTAWIGKGTAFSSETPLHPPGGLVRGTGGAVDYPDRPSPGPGRGELVRAALLDRVGVQGPQEPGPATALP